MWSGDRRAEALPVFRSISWQSLHSSFQVLKNDPESDRAANGSEGGPHRAARIVTRRRARVRRIAPAESPSQGESG